MIAATLIYFQSNIFSSDTVVPNVIEDTQRGNKEIKGIKYTSL